MKIIDLLNKIANSEIDYETKIKINNDIISVGNLIASYIFDKKRLNDEVEIIEEEKKIPEKLNIEDDGNTITLFGEKENEWTILDNVDVIICNKINSIIEYLKSKGE